VLGLMFVLVTLLLPRGIVELPAMWRTARARLSGVAPKPSTPASTPSEVGRA
jgi:hypothetical protein